MKASHASILLHGLDCPWEQVSTAVRDILSEHDGDTAAEAADALGVSVRHVERIRARLRELSVDSKASE